MDAWTYEGALAVFPRFKDASKGNKGKLLKKAKKALDRVCIFEKKTCEEIFSLTPTPCVYVANLIGIDSVQCHAMMSAYGVIEMLLLPPQNTFAFVKFANVDDAEKLRSTLHCTFMTAETKLQTRSLIFVEYALHSTLHTQMTGSSLVDNAHTWKSFGNKLPFISREEFHSFPWAFPPGTLVPGLIIVTDFISEQEEDDLVAYCDSQPYDERQLRHVQHYGYVFDYKDNLPKQGDLEGPLFPAAFDDVLLRMKQEIPAASTVEYSQVNSYPQQNRNLIKQLMKSRLWTAYHGSDEHKNIKRRKTSVDSHITDAQVTITRISDVILSYMFDMTCSQPGYIPNQLTVNKYKPGHGIPRHVDTHSAFTDAIMSLSLGAEIVMEFRLYRCRDPDQRGSKPLQSFCFVVPRRSLLILSGDARYTWTHGIHARTTDVIDGNVVSRVDTRISLTFRRVLLNPICHCTYGELFCDYAGRTGPKRT